MSHSVTPWGPHPGLPATTAENAEKPPELWEFLFPLTFLGAVADIQCCVSFSKLNLLDICPLFFSFFPHMGHYKVLTTFPCPYSRFLLVICFIFFYPKTFLAPQLKGGWCQEAILKPCEHLYTSV